MLSAEGLASLRRVGRRALRGPAARVVWGLGERACCAQGHRAQAIGLHAGLRELAGVAGCGLLPGYRGQESWQGLDGEGDSELSPWTVRGWL